MTSGNHNLSHACHAKVFRAKQQLALCSTTVSAPLIVWHQLPNWTETVFCKILRSMPTRFVFEMSCGMSRVPTVSGGGGDIGRRIAPCRLHLAEALQVGDAKVGEAGLNAGHPAVLLRGPCAQV